MNTQDLLSYNLIKHRDGHKEQNTGQPETRIMKVMYKSIPKPPIPPRAIPGHLTRVKLRTVGNLTQNEARPVGHLTFVSKRLSAVGNKRISQFFDCRYHAGFSVVVVFISWNALNRARGVEKAKATRQRKKQEKKKMTLCLYKRANFADVLKCLRYHEIREMINRRIFKYIAFIMFTVLLEHLRAF